MMVNHVFSLTLSTLIILLSGNLFFSNSVHMVSSQGANPRISTRLARTICGQSSEFSRTKVIQPPAKSSGSGLVGLPCGWIDWRLGPSHPHTYKTCRQMEGSSSTSSSSSSSSGSGRVVGGQEAKPHQFPFIVSLGYLRNHECGGCILNEYWVITALHCRPRRQNSYEGMTVVAGEHNRKVDEGTEQVRNVSLWFDGPPQFNKTSWKNHDISLLKVDKPFVFNENVQPIALPPRDFIHEGLATVVGWGLTERLSENENRILPDILQFTPVPVIPFPVCLETYERIKDEILQLGYDNSSICTGYDDGRANSCSGDSGGPLFVTIDGKDTLLGTVSGGWAGTECAEAGYPNHYKRVSYPFYMDYIAKIMAEN